MVLIRKAGISRWFVSGLIPAFILTACNRSAQHASPIAVQWVDSVASGLIIPGQWLSSHPGDSLSDLPQVHLLGDTYQLPVLGEYTVSKEQIVFRPLIPFTRGLSYEVRFRGRSLGEILVPAAKIGDHPKVVRIYPTQDTLPENLLKLYVEFSRPMREADPLSYIFLLGNGNDTLRDIFLDLRPALWNREGTLLTLWLDPGRIKRDLQPNRNLGAPLRAGESYQLVIDQTWPSKDGGTLATPYYKYFVVGGRDSVSPRISRWEIESPTAQSLHPLIVKFHEPLDAILVKETIAVSDAQGNTVDGKIEMVSEETGLHFIPAGEWQGGVYKVSCESRLEDLAGNNLNRLFDSDITAKQTGMSQDLFTIDFIVE